MSTTKQMPPLYTFNACLKELAEIAELKKVNRMLRRDLLDAYRTIEQIEDSMKQASNDIAKCEDANIALRKRIQQMSLQIAELTGQ